jgi:arylsulfatase A-like enzyme
MKSKTRIVVVALVVLLPAIVGYWFFTVRSTRLGQDPDKKYNVVMIVSDALRQDVLGCYGGVAKTPNIDWLEANGVLFENAYSTSPWTSPSSVSIFTGNYATSYGYAREGQTRKGGDPQAPTDVYVPQIYVPEDELLFVEALGLLGYHNEMVVENVNASMHNNVQGFVSIPQFTPSDEMAIRINKITRSRLYHAWDESDAYGFSFLVLKNLLEQDPDRNFFTLHWILDPHAPYSPIERFASRIDVDESKLNHPKSYYSKHIYDKSQCTEPEVKFIRDLYVAEVESVDERVGFVLSALSEKKLLDNTLIVFTSDHGEQFGEHGLWEHGGHGKGCHYYETLLRVPLIIAGPGLPKGKSVSSKVSLIGLMPTLKELLGVKYDDDMEGESFASLMFEGESEGDFLYFDDVQEHDQLDAALQGSYKLISLENDAFELYDVVHDPQESTNEASRNPERVESIYKIILHMRAENGERQRKNLAALGNELPMMSEEKKQKVIEKLRSLGYIN